jgi:DNA processing protein
MGGPHRAADAAAPESRHAGRRFVAGILNPGGLVAERPREVAPPPRVRARGEAGYPPALLVLADAPPRVWLRGADVPAPGSCVAIVGSRAASAYGLSMARRLAADLAGLGFAVVSGLARGIDAAAHGGALHAGGRTIAVVPSGLDRVTPPEHAALAESIALGGALLSETESGGPFGRGAFVKRNRLIAALSAVTVVVEAAERSGALTTASWALSLGRPVLAVPGDVDRPTARGCLALLRGGAKPCGDAGDVTALLPPRPARDADPAARVAGALDATARTLDDLAMRAGVEPPGALAELLRLEWAGLALPCPGQRWKSRA